MGLYKPTEHPHILDEMDLHDPHCKKCDHDHYIGGDCGRCYHSDSGSDKDDKTHCDLRYREGEGWKICPPEQLGKESRDCWDSIDSEIMTNWRDLLK